jgi:hypothetical protein
MVAVEQSCSQREESGRFLKKATQKLFVMLGHGRGRRRSP